MTNAKIFMCYVFRVFGAGKTELVYKVIFYALSHKQTVAFAIPRRDVVIELFPRIKNAFPNSKVVTVYGGHTGSLTGDIVLLTTHQLYRYEKYFDLIIIDEIDAFPFKDNFVLGKKHSRYLLEDIKEENEDDEKENDAYDGLRPKK